MENSDLSMTEVGKMLREVYRLFKRRTEERRVADVNLSPEQFGLLQALSHTEQEVIQKDMADLMGKDKSSILRLIDYLEENELVRRVADSKDRRKNYLMVTKLGYRIIDQYQKVVNELMKDIQQGLTQSEIDVFHKVVNHAKCNAEKL